jgi:transcriptional regulator with XRE-family HTH domain
MSFKIRRRIRRPILKALRRARADAGLTISELARRAGVSRDTISNAERGEHSLQASTLHKVARALGKAPSELLAEEERLAPKVESRSSLQLPLNGFFVGDGVEDERRAVWEAAADQARSLREDGRARIEELLAACRASRERGEPRAARREYMDEMGTLLEEVYAAEVALGEAYIEAAITEADSDAKVPRYLREESRVTRDFYVELLGLVQSAGLSVRTGNDAAAAKRAAKVQPGRRPHSVEEPKAA